LPSLTGFVDSDGHALGRPVGVAVDKRGALLVAAGRRQFPLEGRLCGPLNLVL
jgi:glucose/arabinose dehydrogenase